LERHYVKEGTDVTIVATGHLVWEALIAAEALEAKGISEVINIHTIKPQTEEAILKSLAKCGNCRRTQHIRRFRRKHSRVLA
jgi:transketolase C-terminal domain/subunit